MFLLIPTSASVVAENVALAHSPGIGHQIRDYSSLGSYKGGAYCTGLVSWVSSSMFILEF